MDGPMTGHPILTRKDPGKWVIRGAPLTARPSGPGQDDRHRQSEGASARPPPRSTSGRLQPVWGRRSGGRPAGGARRRGWGSHTRPGRSPRTTSSWRAEIREAIQETEVPGLSAIPSTIDLAGAESGWSASFHVRTGFGRLSSPLGRLRLRSAGLPSVAGPAHPSAPPTAPRRADRPDPVQYALELGAPEERPLVQRANPGLRLSGIVADDVRCRDEARGPGDRRGAHLLRVPSV